MRSFLLYVVAPCLGGALLWVGMTFPKLTLPAMLERMKNQLVGTWWALGVMAILMPIVVTLQGWLIVIGLAALAGYASPILFRWMLARRMKPVEPPSPISIESDAPDSESPAEQE